MTDATLFVGGRVYTGRRYAHALLVEGNRVLAAGPEDTVRRQAATGTERVELGGGLVVPGLADAHLHLGELARSREGFDAGSARSIAGLGDRLARWASDRPLAPIVGNGLDPERLAERRWPTPAELDAAVRDRPVVLYHASGHAAAGNTVALERAFGPGAPRETAGATSGLVLEEALAALRPIVDEALPITFEAMESTVRELAALGLTAVGTMNTGEEELSVLRRLDDAGRLPIRVRAYVPLGRLPGTGLRPKRDGEKRFAVVGVKGFLDGAFGPRTASLAAAYTDDSSSRGVDRGDDATLPAILRAARDQGLAPALHAIGDRAVERAVRLLSGIGSGDPPTRIEHASLTPPALLRPLRALGAYLAVQPSFVLSDTWLPDRLGPARSRWAYAFRTLSDLGVPLAGSSDAPYDRPDPWWGMLGAVRRRDELGRSANPWPDQALTETEALALYTTRAHRAIGEAEAGELEPGSPADLAVLSVPRIGEAMRRGRVAVRATWVAGAPVGRAAPARGRP